MAYRIDWKSTSKWIGTNQTEMEGEEEYATREEAEVALSEMENSIFVMDEVLDAAVEGHGIEGWLEIVETA